MQFCRVGNEGRSGRGPKARTRVLGSRRARAKGVLAGNISVRESVSPGAVKDRLPVSCCKHFHTIHVFERHYSKTLQKKCCLDIFDVFRLLVNVRRENMALPKMENAMLFKIRAHRQDSAWGTDCKYFM